MALSALCPTLVSRSHLWCMPGAVEMDRKVPLWGEQQYFKGQEVLLKFERISFVTLTPCFTLFSDLFGKSSCSTSNIVRQQRSRQVCSITTKWSNHNLHWMLGLKALSYILCIISLLISLYLASHPFMCTDVRPLRQRDTNVLYWNNEEVVYLTVHRVCFLKTNMYVFPYTKFVHVLHPFVSCTVWRRLVRDAMEAFCILCVHFHLLWTDYKATCYRYIKVTRAVIVLIADVKKKKRIYIQYIFNEVEVHCGCNCLKKRRL